MKDVAKCAGGMDIQSTVWNQTLGEHVAAIFARESSAFTGGGESFDFDTLLVEVDNQSISYLHAPGEGDSPGAGVKYTVVMGNEYGERKDYSAVPRPGEVTHLSLAEAMRNQVMPEVLERIRDTNVRFERTILTLLENIRPITLC